MKTLAFILDGYPPTWMFVRLGVLCIGAPAISTLLSWCLVRRVKGGALWALAPAIVAACAVLFPAIELYDWGYPYNPSPAFLIGPVVAAEVPFAAILAIVRHLEQGPNKAPATPMSITSPAAQEPRQP